MITFSNEEKNLFLSEIKVKILLSLLESPKNSKELKKDIKSSSAVHTNLNYFLSNNFVNKNKRSVFHLSSKGEILAINLVSLIENFYVIIKNREFWESHDTNAIPEIFVNKIKYLKNAKYLGLNKRHKVKNPLIDSLYLFLKGENFKVNNKLCMVLPIFSSYHADFLRTYLEMGGNIEIIISEEIFNPFTEYCDIDVLKNYSRNGQLTMWELKGDLKLNISFSDDIFILALFGKNGFFDYDTVLFDESKSAINFGKQIFNYYKFDSKEIL